MNIKLLLLVIFFSPLLNAQDIEQISRSRELTEIRNNLNLDGIRDVNNRNQPLVDGSPYLFKNWNNKSKIYYDNRVYIINNFNYNIYSERFEAKLSEDSILIINPRNINSILINEKTFGRYLDPEFQRNSYFEEIVKISDDYLLLKKYIVVIKEGPRNPLTKEKIANDKLVKSEIFYMCDLKDNKLKKVKLKKSTVQSLFRKEVLEGVNIYVNENHLNYRDPEDVKRIVHHYNTL
jgi:hypothetical protein